MHKHLRSGFLGVIIVLSFALAVFVLKAGKSAPTATTPYPSLAKEGSLAPTDGEYRAATHSIIAEVRVAYPAAKTAYDREQALTVALNNLLDVRVPREEKDFHLELAVSLELTRSGSPDGWKRFLATVEKTDWLK